VYRDDDNGKWLIQEGVAILIDPSEKWISENQFPPQPIDPPLNDDLVSAYEAIAELFEANIQLQQRIEALEGTDNGV
jgi:hypothetical protein